MSFLEFCSGCLSNIARDLVHLTVNELRYPCCFNRFVEELEKEKDSLIATRDDVKERITHAEEQTKRPAHVMRKWLENAKNDIEKVDELLAKARRKKSCLPYCPNWICRYYLGKKLANKKVEVGNCKNEGSQYIKLKRITTLPREMPDFHAGKYLGFHSRQDASEQLMNAVKDDDVSLIGLYGMGGCGKTTLAREVKRIAVAENLFDKVLFVPVSSTVDVPRIQDKIASSLSYKFPAAEKDERERAKRLHERLTKEKKILVILDDVWEKLNFGAIGIPLGEYHKGGRYKVLITTRDEDVCKLMDCQKKILLQILRDDEAWTLFQKQAGLSESATSDTLKNLARKISDECKGLPVAIVAVASTLKGKAEEHWEVDWID